MARADGTPPRRLAGVGKGVLVGVPAALVAGWIKLMQELFTQRGGGLVGGWAQFVEYARMAGSFVGVFSWLLVPLGVVIGGIVGAIIRRRRPSALAGALIGALVAGLVCVAVTGTVRATTDVKLRVWEFSAFAAGASAVVSALGAARARRA
jgi:hypothetical protein